MDENVIFGKQESPNTSEEQNSSSSVASGKAIPVSVQPGDPVVPNVESQEPVVLEGEPSTSGEDAPGGPPRTGGGIVKKIIIGLVIFIVLIFLVMLFLPKGQSNKKVKLVWWGLWEEQRVMQPIISDFHKEHPNITVEYVKQDPKQYRQKLLTRIKNGTGPDIFRYHNSWVPMLSENLLPLSTDVISPNEFKKTFYPVMQKDLTRNGGIYGVPLGADTLGLFINTDLFEAAGVSPPQTWDDFVKAARTLTVKDDGKIKTAGAALGTFGNVTHSPDILSLLFVQQGIDIKKFPTYDVKKKSDVLDFYTAFAKGEQNVWDSTLDESIMSFARGNLAMYIGFSWDIFRIQSINRNLPFKTYPVPQLVGQNATLASYWAEGVSSESPNKKEAMLFMQYLIKKETAQKFYSESAKTRPFGEPYARRELANSLKKNELVYPFVAQLTGASSSFFASDTNDGEGGINALSNTYLGNAINAITDDNTSAQTAVETLNQGVSQVFQKYGIR